MSSISHDPAEREASAPPAANPFEAKLEAVLFSSESPLPVKRLSEVTSGAKGEVLAAIDRLNVFYAETGRAFRIVELAGGFQMVTTPEYAETLAALHKERVPSRLSRAALETLSIIAFKQPVTRAEIDAIRGVSASDRVLRNLIERKLVRIAGRAELPGRPLLYGTTREFLAYFGLSSVTDLPRTDELKALLAGRVDEEAARAVWDDLPDELEDTGRAEIREDPFRDSNRMAKEVEADLPEEELERDPMLDENEEELDASDSMLDENEVVP
jgi:segregation and condensation protein B